MIATRVIGAVMAVVLLLGLPHTNAVDTEVSLKEALESVSAYCLEKVDKPEYGDEWFCYCFVASAVNFPDTFRDAYYQSLCETLNSCNGELDARKYTEYSRVILALTALEFDPTAVAGYDLTLPLADFDGTVRQGVNGAVFALLALDSGHYRIPAVEDGKTQATRERYVTYILDRQLGDGGFSVSGTTADPDMTAMALQALASYAGDAKVDAAIEDALTYLSTVQHTDGGFDNWGVENAESCAQVLLALCELGISPEDTRFVKNGSTVLDALLRYRNTDGSFRHTKEGNTDFLATRQAYMALTALWRTQEGMSPFYALEGRISFSDIAGHKNRTAILALAREGILSGRGDGTFDPDATMTRAEFAALIVRAVGITPTDLGLFDDVQETAWYAPYVGAAYESGIVKGTSATQFSPDAAITEGEAETMVARAAPLLQLALEPGEAWRTSQAPASRSAVVQLLYDLLSDAGRIS